MHNISANIFTFFRIIEFGTFFDLFAIIHFNLILVYSNKAVILQETSDAFNFLLFLLNSFSSFVLSKFYKHSSN